MRWTGTGRSYAAGGAADGGYPDVVATGEFVERCRLLRHQNRLALRKNQHAGREADLLSATSKKPEQDERIMIGILGRTDAKFRLNEAATAAEAANTP